RPLEGLVVVAQAPTFIRLQGEARMGRPARGESVTVDGAASLEPYDAIETGAQGRAAITWPRGAAATLEPESLARLLPGSADGTVRLELQRGGVWLSTGPDAGSALVELSTPDAVRVVGQRFQARRDQAGRLVLTTVDVAVELWAQDTRQEVPAGATSEVLAGR